jgi:hypothetical protein
MDIIEELLQFNQPFLIKYGLSIKDGAILSALNGGQFNTTAKQFVKALPLVGNNHRTLKEKLHILEEMEIISSKLLTDKETYLTLKKGDFNTNSCQFCGVDDVYLHAHHYPIRRASGGLDTINICPNCHTKFHMLADYEKRYVFNEPFITYWNFTEQEWISKFGEF